MVALALVTISVVCLAYANGSNDNFKGVATLFGAGAVNYRRALGYATVATLCGSLTAIVLAHGLLKSFSGKGLVPAPLTTSTTYVAAVALGAALTVLLATRIGMPISTTHSLVGALVGAALASGSAIYWNTLLIAFFAPLIVSPLVAVVGTGSCYLVLRSLRQRFGIVEETCVCVGNRIVEVVPSGGAAAMERAAQLSLTIGDTVTCRSRYRGDVLGFEVGRTVDSLHFVSAGLVSFARGLNDTPKIAALLLIAPAFGEFTATALVGVLIGAGGLIAARRVADTMSHKITTMTHGQGFTANLLSGLIIVGASRFGMPVSTTHVTCGALFGIGTVTRQGRIAMIAKILGAWIITLPLAATLGAASYWAGSLFAAI